MPKNQFSVEESYYDVHLKNSTTFQSRNAFPNVNSYCIEVEFKPGFGDFSQRFSARPYSRDYGNFNQKKQSTTFLRTYLRNNRITVDLQSGSGCSFTMWFFKKRSADFNQATILGCVQLCSRHLRRRSKSPGIELVYYRQPQFFACTCRIANS